MSVTLFVLFIIALLITLAGLVLSPRLQPRRKPNKYSMASRGRSIVDAAPSPARQRRVPTSDDQQIAPLRRRVPATTTSAYQAAPTRRRASAYSDEINTEPVITRRTRAVAPAASGSLAPMTRRVGISTGVAYPGPLEILKDQLGSWKVSLPLLLMIFLLCFYLVNAFLPHPLIWTPVSFNSPNAAPTAASAKAPVYTASQHLIRLGQLDPAQYQSTQEYNIWAYSACSAASMTEVINSYGHTYRITTILEYESSIHEITPQEGLLEDSGIQHTGAHFGFKTTWGHNLSLNQVIAAANSGTPVIVSFPPETFPGGHILVVRGGDSNYVYLADSSRLNWTQLTRARFMQLWRGFSAIMTPA